MTLFLERVDTAPINGNNFDLQFLQWLWVLVDTLNEDLNLIEAAVLSETLVTDITQLVEGNSLYIPTNVALTTFQLPDFINVGQRVRIAGFGAGGWIILTGAGQTIKIANVGGSASTSVSSSSRYDSIELICVVANTTWITLSSETSGFVVV